jgi:hypothetical protein
VCVYLSIHEYLPVCLSVCRCASVALPLPGLLAGGFGCAAAPLRGKNSKTIIQTGIAVYAMYLQLWFMVYVYLIACLAVGRTRRLVVDFDFLKPQHHNSGVQTNKHTDTDKDTHTDTQILKYTNTTRRVTPFALLECVCREGGSGWSE